MRGTFVFPQADNDFMQLLEIRANNGAQDDVETVFVLTGETYFVPTRLFAFDDPALYHDASAHAVTPKTRPMAETVARFYADQPGPKLINRVHTHTNGRPRPSQGDKKVGPNRKQTFDRYFDDYEFFLGIHALQDPCEPDPARLRRAHQTAEHAVTWWGENRKHTLAVYDAQYNPRPVLVR